MDLRKFNIDIFSLFNDRWAVLTAGKGKDSNPMTISWGTLGSIWGNAGQAKPIATVYVKPVRFTYPIMEKQDTFTISFFPEEYRKDLAILGSKSGKDCDKLALTKLTPIYGDNGVTYKEANLTIICKKIYDDSMDREKIPEYAINLFYKQGEVLDIIQAPQD